MKLKENLQTIIKQKRIREMQKKQAEIRELNGLSNEDDNDGDEEEEYEPENKPKKLQNIEVGINEYTN